MPKVEDFQAIDIAFLKRVAGRGPVSGRLTWSWEGEETGAIGYRMDANSVTLTYTYREEGAAAEAVCERVPLTHTKTNFGARRSWFLCPTCQRRCRILLGGNRFRCRVCWRAKYESQYEPPLIRISYRRWKIRRKIENAGGESWEWGLDDGFPEKPLRMHWSTYARLRGLDETLAKRWLVGVEEWLEQTAPEGSAGDPFRSR